MLNSSFNLRDMIHRRQFLTAGTTGIGSLALASLLPGTGQALAADGPFVAKKTHYTPKAKNIIFMFMAGAPSQLDLFDYKPKLNELDGTNIDPELMKGSLFANFDLEERIPKFLGSPYKFKQHGESGAWVSELMPHIASIADELTFVKSMHTDLTAFNHHGAQILLLTGSELEGRPSMGSWISYGLGSENQNLPAFVVLLSNDLPRGGPGLYGPGFLPSVHQGVRFRNEGDPVLYLSNPPGVSEKARRRSLAAINALNGLHRDTIGDPEIDTRISAFELAYKMQASVPDLIDVGSEPKHILEMYGADPDQPSFARNCLQARRLIEAGVRMVQLVDLDWDHHGDKIQRDLIHALPRQCKYTDQAAAALVLDLKQRGLLDETLIVFAGEFGRTAMNEERNGSTLLGRDHHTEAFTVWLAGGGTKPGITFGATDELGYRVTENPVHTRDLHATILHLLGMDHERLTFRYQGREFRLTDIGGRVVHEILT